MDQQKLRNSPDRAGVPGPPGPPWTPGLPARGPGEFKDLAPGRVFGPLGPQAGRPGVQGGPEAGRRRPVKRFDL